MAQAQLNIYRALNPRSVLIGQEATEALIVARAEMLGLDDGVGSQPNGLSAQDVRAHNWSLAVRTGIARVVYDKPDAGEVSLEQPPQGPFASSKYSLELIVELAMEDAPDYDDHQFPSVGERRDYVRALYVALARDIADSIQLLIPAGLRWFVWVKGYTGTGFWESPEAA